MKSIHLAISLSLIAGLAFLANAQDIEKIVEGIEKSPYYEAAEQCVKVNEKELNRNIQQKIDEKKDAVAAINGQIKRKFVESKTSEPEDPDACFDAQSRIYIFVSRSILISVLKSFAADIDTLGNDNIRLVFRAFPKDFLHRFLQKDQDCMDENCVVKAKVIVGESLFKRYVVDKVPAVIFDPDPTISHEDWLLVYGATSLHQALTLFHRDSGQQELKLAANRVGQN